MTSARFRYLVGWGLVLLMAAFPTACDLGPVPTPTNTLPPPTNTVLPTAAILPTVPAATATNTPLPPPTSVPTSVPTATAEPSPTPTQLPAPTTQVGGYKYPAPKLVAPPNGQGYAGEFRWEPERLAADEFYGVSVSYYHNKQLRFWGGQSKDPILIAKVTWEKSDDNFYTWWVQILRDTGKKNADGSPIGTPVSPPSEVWRFYYEP